MFLHEGSTAHFAAALKVVAQVVEFEAKVNRLVRGLWLFLFLLHIGIMQLSC